MAFIVESVTGLSNSTSYLSLADFKTYHDDRGGVYSTYSDGALREALVRATDFIDRRWRGKFVGARLLTSQALEWPRTNAFYFDGRTISGVVAEIEQATAELTLRSAAEFAKTTSSRIDPDPVLDETHRVLSSKSESVGSVQRAVAFSGGDSAILLWRRFPAVEGLLHELVREARILERV